MWKKCACELYADRIRQQFMDERKYARILIVRSHQTDEKITHPSTKRSGELMCQSNQWKLASVQESVTRSAALYNGQAIDSWFVILSIKWVSWFSLLSGTERQLLTCTHAACIHFEARCEDIYVTGYCIQPELTRFAKSEPSVQSRALTDLKFRQLPEKMSTAAQHYRLPKCVSRSVAERSFNWPWVNGSWLTELSVQVCGSERDAAWWCDGKTKCVRHGSRACYGGRIGNERKMRLMQFDREIELCAEQPENCQYFLSGNDDSIR